MNAGNEMGTGKQKTNSGKQSYLPEKENPWLIAKSRSEKDLWDKTDKSRVEVSVIYGKYSRFFF